VPAAKPAVLPQPKTLYFQKDPAPAAKPAAAPPQQVVYQDTAQPTGPEKVLLPPSATNVTPPVIGAIKLQTEAELRRDIVAEVEQYKQPAIFSTFPSNYKQVTDPGSVKHPLPPMFERVEPGYVCYRRLYFEDLNSERYGWEVGPLQPFLSAAIFYKDLALWPYHIGTRPCQRYECSAGYCLPGDPVPYLLYPIEWSVTGGLLEAGTVVGLYALFP
jgi:hypothetical protein